MGRLRLAYQLWRYGSILIGERQPAGRPRIAGSVSSVQCPPFPKSVMDYGSCHMPQSGNIIWGGYHYVLADWKVPERAPYLYGGLAFVLNVPHYNQQVYVAVFIVVAPRPGAK